MENPSISRIHEPRKSENTKNNINLTQKEFNHKEIKSKHDREFDL